MSTPAIGTTVKTRTMKLAWIAVWFWNMKIQTATGTKLPADIRTRNLVARLQPEHSVSKAAKTNAEGQADGGDAPRSLRNPRWGNWRSNPNPTSVSVSAVAAAASAARCGVRAHAEGKPFDEQRRHLGAVGVKQGGRGDVERKPCRCSPTNVASTRKSTLKIGQMRSCPGRDQPIATSATITQTADRNVSGQVLEIGGEQPEGYREEYRGPLVQPAGEVETRSRR